MIDPSSPYVDVDELLALCTCTRSYVWVSPAAVKAGAVYCRRCAPPGDWSPPYRPVLLQWNPAEDRYNTIGAA